MTSYRIIPARAALSQTSTRSVIAQAAIAARSSRSIPAFVALAVAPTQAPTGATVAQAIPSGITVRK